ncbi:hypothetical protein QVN60_00245 [Yersinia aleksiciae]|uniref:hypothetical protein n=1 Tax=Yersinia aleksiciae TaxID=263819 RepID=UPI0011AA78B8|nr:hypothetical protein [Yersinia aleksiciae]MDN0121644.1 hypothetical protein [Yersinia aleksiciae]
MKCVLILLIAIIISASVAQAFAKPDYSYRSVIPVESPFAPSTFKISPNATVTSAPLQQHIEDLDKLRNQRHIPDSLPAKVWWLLLPMIVFSHIGTVYDGHYAPGSVSPARTELHIGG